MRVRQLGLARVMPEQLSMRGQRLDGEMPASLAVSSAASDHVQLMWTRVVDAGRFSSDNPGLHSPTGLMGRGMKPPPQFGQTFRSRSAQAVHQVHS